MIRIDLLVAVLTLGILASACGTNDNPSIAAQPDSVTTPQWDLAAAAVGHQTSIVAIAECIPSNEYQTEPTVRLIETNTGLKLWYVYPANHEKDYLASSSNISYARTNHNGHKTILLQNYAGTLTYFGWDGTTFTYLNNGQVSGRHQCTIIDKKIK